MKLPKLLLFIDGPVPSKEDKKNLVKFAGANVEQRNRRLILPSHNPEKCDGVFGNVPENYKHLPSAEKAMREWAEAMQKAHSETGDAKAPAPPAEVKDAPVLGEKEPVLEEAPALQEAPAVEKSTGRRRRKPADDK